jgi:flagellar protein FlaG
MLAERMDATSGAVGRYWVEPLARIAVQRQEANRAYSVRGLRLLSPKRLNEERAKQEAESRLEGQEDKTGADFRKRQSLLSESMLQSTLNKMETFVSAVYHHLEYDYHERSGEYFVKVIDDKTDEVVREIPPEKILDIYSSLMEMVGLFLDERR